MDIYNWILNRKIKKLIRNDSRQKSFLNLNEIHSILLLFDTADYAEADTFVKQLKKLKKDVTAYGFQNKNDISDHTKSLYNIIPAKEVSLWKRDKLYELGNTLNKERYDALINLSIHSILELEYLSANANASLKVGLKKVGYPVYDISISSSTDNENEHNLDVKGLGEQVLHYLNLIRSK